MNNNLHNIAGLLFDLGINPADHGKYLNAAAARVIGYRLQLPSEPTVGEAMDYYKEYLEPKVAVVLDAIVERVPIDVEQVIYITGQIWKMRYNMVHCPVGAIGRKLLDLCVKEARIETGVDFTDDSLGRLAAAISEGMDD